MSLFQDEDTSPSRPLPAFEPNRTAYKDISVDTEYTPVGTILTAIEGKPWTVTWYSQILNRDNAVSALQNSRLEINQQYKRIYNLELRATVPLPVNPEFRPESQEFTVRGESNMFPGVRPNLGDMFTATLLDGRQALFQVSSPPEQRTIYLQTTYRIEYVLLNFLDADLQKKLNDKTVENYHFVASFLDSGINPVITDQSHDDYRKLMEWRERMPQYYLTKYFNKEYGTLILPGQGSKLIYDPFLTVFVSALWGNENIGPFHGMRFLNVMDGTIRNLKSVLDAILTQNMLTMDLVEQKIPPVNTATFLQNPFFYGASYLGIPYVCYPIDKANYSTTGWRDYKVKAVDLVNGYRKTPAVRYTLEQSYPDDDLVPNPQGWNLSIKDVSVDDFYIFSEAFYARQPEKLSVLETLVWESMDKGQVSASHLMELLNNSRNWDDLNQFYYVPILYALIPAALRGLSG